MLDFSLQTESMEVKGVTSCKVEEEFELVEPEDRIQLLVWLSYAEDTQLYTSTLGPLSDIVDILF